MLDQIVFIKRSIWAFAVLLLFWHFGSYTNFVFPTLAWIAARSLSIPLSLRCSVITPVRSLPSSSVDSIILAFSWIQLCKTHKNNMCTIRMYVCTTRVHTLTKAISSIIQDRHNTPKLISSMKHLLWYSLQNEHSQLYFLLRKMKNINLIIPLFSGAMILCFTNHDELRRSIWIYADSLL